MKIAIPCENGEVMQHFGHATEFTVYTIEDIKPIEKETVTFDDTNHEKVAGGLKSRGVDLVICGNIGEGADAAIDEDGSYTSKEDVALYIHTYGHLPENYITKDEARALGWEGGSVEVYQEGAAIGGDRFGNREGLLPEETGRTYTECDINTLGADSRRAERLIFSNDGLYFYTSDHYASFTELTVDGGTVIWN